MNWYNEELNLNLSLGGSSSPTLPLLKQKDDQGDSGYNNYNCECVSSSDPVIPSMQGTLRACKFRSSLDSKSPSTSLKIYQSTVTPPITESSSSSGSLEIYRPTITPSISKSSSSSSSGKIDQPISPSLRPIRSVIQKRVGKKTRSMESNSQFRRSLRNMPYVSTTGNGPHGKTVTGILYPRSEEDTVIVCVCHGRALSPANFVRHGGGMDVANPLKHIVVLSDF